MASYEYTLARTQSHLLQTDHVLELGCGTGSTALVLAPGVGAYLGTDLSDEMIAIAREKNAHDGVAHLRFDTFDLGTHQMDQQFDAILAFNLLHLVPDLKAALRRFDHMLKPGGVFISKTICYSSDWRGIALRAIMAVGPIRSRIAQGKRSGSSFHHCVRWHWRGYRGRRHEGRRPRLPDEG